MAETVKPLIEFKGEFEKQGKYEKVKADFKADARYKGFFEQPGTEALVDKLMTSMPATPEALYSVILGVRGGMEFGDIPKPGATPPRAPDPATPPHLRPTPPPMPEPEKKTDESLKVRIEGMNENERRLVREWNMTPEQYFAWIDAEAEKVAASEIGRPPKKEGGSK